MMGGNWRWSMDGLLLNGIKEREIYFARLFLFYFLEANT